MGELSQMPLHLLFTVPHWRIVLDLHLQEGLEKWLLSTKFPGCKPSKQGFYSVCGITFYGQPLNSVLFFSYYVNVLRYYHQKYIGRWGKVERRDQQGWVTKIYYSYGRTTCSQIWDCFSPKQKKSLLHIFYELFSSTVDYVFIVVDKTEIRVKK